MSASNHNSTVALLAVTFAALGGAALHAQAPTTWEEIPVAAGVKRDRKAELGADPESTRVTRVYLYNTTIEMVLKYYLMKLGGSRDAPVDSAAVLPGTTTLISQHVVFYSFDDQCALPPPAASTQGTTTGDADCKAWRRGKDKKHTLDVNRIFLEPGTWVERATFHWFSRETGGDLIRWQVDVRDSGLSDNWKHYAPTTTVIIERLVVERKAR